MTDTIPGPRLGDLFLRDAMNGEFKDIDPDKRQVLVSFPHETVDSYKTMFGNRAFAESFEKRLPTMCWQHDLRDPIGHALTAQVTPKTNEIRGEFDDFDAVPNAKRAFSQIESGTITDFSFGFKNAKFQPTGQRGISRITSAFMAEFSPVTIGSIPGAKAVGLREDGIIIMEMAEILQLRDSGLVTFDGFRALVEAHHPELLEKIVVVDPGKRAAAAVDDDSAGPDAEDAPKWTKHDSGTHSATGPKGESLRVKPTTDDAGKHTGHSWSVADDSGEHVDSGTSDSTDPASAKKSAFEAMMKKGKRDDDEVGFGFVLPDDPDDIDADFVRSVITTAFPELGIILRDAAIAIGPHIGTSTDGGGTDNTIAASLATQTDSALDSAMEYLRGVDVATLPDDVQQSIALVQAASISSDALLDAMGIEDPDEGGRGEDLDDDEIRSEAEAAEVAEKQETMRQEALAKLDARSERRKPAA